MPVTYVIQARLFVIDEQGTIGTKRQAQEWNPGTVLETVIATTRSEARRLRDELRRGHPRASVTLERIG